MTDDHEGTDFNMYLRLCDLEEIMIEVLVVILVLPLSIYLSIYLSISMLITTRTIPTDIISTYKQE